MWMPIKEIAQNIGFNNSMSTNVLSKIEIAFETLWYSLRYKEMSSRWCRSVSAQSFRRIYRWSLSEREMFFLGLMNSEKCSYLFHGLLELSLLMKLVKHWMAFITKDSLWKSYYKQNKNNNLYVYPNFNRKSL